jgi:hypothetical protein
MNRIVILFDFWINGGEKIVEKVENLSYSKYLTENKRLYNLYLVFGEIS